MRTIHVLLSACLFLMSSVAAQAADTINDPDSATIYLLQCKFSGVTPAYEDMAKADNSVKSADEFHKADMAKQLAASLRARFAILDGVKQITLRFASQFGEYDAQNSEYDFDISDGTYVPARVFGRDLHITLTNGTIAQSWKLPAKDAAEILRKTQGQRSVKLALRLTLQTSPPAIDGQPAILNTRIDSYDVLNPWNGAKLGNSVAEAAR